MLGRLSADSLVHDIQELRNVPRKQFLSLAKKFRENPLLLNSVTSQHRWSQDLFTRFDTVVVSTNYELKDDAGIFTLRAAIRDNSSSLHALQL